MSKNNITTGLGEVAKAYCTSDRKKYQVKTAIVLDKKDPTNLKKAYLIVLFQDPKKYIRNSKGKMVRDTRYHFAFKTKTNCFELKEYTEYRWDGWFKLKPVKTFRVTWKENSKESQKFHYFAQNHKICTKIIESYSQAAEVATARYFKAINSSTPAKS